MVPVLLTAAVYLLIFLTILIRSIIIQLISWCTYVICPIDIIILHIACIL